MALSIEVAGREAPGGLPQRHLRLGCQQHGEVELEHRHAFGDLERFGDIGVDLTDGADDIAPE